MRPKLSVLLLACTLVACGGGDDYENELRQISERLNNQDVGQQLRTAQSPQQLAVALREAAGLMEESSRDLAELDPPDDVSEAHRDVTEGARETADVLRRIADQAQRGSRRDFLASLNELVTSGATKRLEDGLKELDEKGYDVQSEASGL